MFIFLHPILRGHGVAGFLDQNVGVAGRCRVVPIGRETANRAANKVAGADVHHDKYCRLNISDLLIVHLNTEADSPICRKLGDHTYLTWNNEQPSTASTTGHNARPGGSAG